MKFKPATLSRGADRSGRRAFTLAEVLAALVFMAIVIPVAVQGLRVASLAGEVGQRKAVAGRIAERVLNEWLIAGQTRSTAQNGTTQEGTQQFRWSLRAERWTADTTAALNLVTVQVFFPVQGREYDVRVSTIVGNSL